MFELSLITTLIFGLLGWLGGPGLVNEPYDGALAIEFTPPAKAPERSRIQAPPPPQRFGISVADRARVLALHRFLSKLGFELGLKGHMRAWLGKSRLRGGERGCPSQEDNRDRGAV